jgi:tol-pal system protein YbgF
VTGYSVPAGRSGGRGRARRLLRCVLPLFLAVVATGCATKRDIRDLREDLLRQQARQDSVMRLVQVQNRQIMDSLALATNQLMNVRGDLTNQLGQLREQIVQVSELTGQVQVRLTQLDQQLAGVQTGGGVPAPGGAAAGAPTVITPTRPATQPVADDQFDMAQQFYEIGMEQVNRSNAGTARRAFETVVDSFPTHPLAAEAQRQVGETHAMERNWDQALRAFDRVVERFPDSDAAPRALYRAGVISQERGNIERARQYFQRVISGYPNSDARRSAEDALARLR